MWGGAEKVLKIDQQLIHACRPVVLVNRRKELARDGGLTNLMIELEIPAHERSCDSGTALGARELHGYPHGLMLSLQLLGREPAVDVRAGLAAFSGGQAYAAVDDLDMTGGTCSRRRAQAGSRSSCPLGSRRCFLPLGP
jgi:hypothetical protein